MTDHNHYKTWVAEAPERFAGRVVGTGHCVPFVREATGAPPTGHWRRGAKVRWRELPPGIAIATFNTAGRYGNNVDGSSHAAILLGQDLEGLHVWDAWIGRPVSRRHIRFKNGVGLAGDDGDAYAVIQTAPPTGTVG